MPVAVVIPTLNEAVLLPHLLDDLGELDFLRDVVVADGGSQDDTVRLARDAGVRVIHAERGRAVQMNAGAAAATGDWLCFLHADVRMDDAARDALRGFVETGRGEAAVWRLAIDGRGWWLRAVEFGARIRDRLGGLPYGDQGLVVRRTLFEAVGGFPEIPVMEDVAMVRALRRHARVRRLPAALLVSARRWRREGQYRTWFRNLALTSAFFAGVSPERLVRWYPPEPR